MIKFMLTIQVTLIAAIIYICTPLPVDSCKLHVVVEGKIKALATVDKSKPILLATW